MKESEIKNVVREAYKSAPILIKLYPDKTVRSFNGLAGLYNYFQDEASFWNSLIEINNNQRINAVRGQVLRIFQHIQTVLNSDQYTVQSNISVVRTAISGSGNPRIIYSTSKPVKQLVNMCSSGQYSETYISTYIGFLQDERFSDNNLHGQLAAYFALNPFSTPEQNIEIKNFLDKTISNTQGIIEQTEKDQSEYWDKVKGEYETVTTGIKSEYEQFFEARKKEQWEQSKSWKSNLDNANIRLAELENLYQEKLRLEAPAKYWEDLESEYIKKGKIWIGWAVGSTFVLGVALVTILYFIPDTLKGSITDIGSGTIRSTLILAAAVSMCVYVIRLFVKLATSSFHLARDAKERHTLANLYLSLIEKNAVEKESRDIILNALFSRADSGLLKGDSSPTIPEGLSSVIMKNIK